MCLLQFTIHKNIVSITVHYNLYKMSLFLSTDIDLKKASKSFAQHFSCGSSVTGEDEIVIQGDVTDDVIDFIQEKWPEVCITLLIIIM